MTNRLYEQRKKKYFTDDIENITSKELILKLYTSCENLFQLVNHDPKTKHAKKFLSQIIETTNEFMKDSKEVHVQTFIHHTKGRPYLFELIRLNKEGLLENKNFSSTFVNLLEESLNKIGFSYNTHLTQEDIKKLLMITTSINKPDANIKLSLEDNEIYNIEHKKSRK